MPDDRSSSIERANALLAQMTLAEKTRQLSGIMPTSIMGPGGLDPKALKANLGLGIGHIASPAAAVQEPGQIAALTNGIQRYLVEGTRLGIPAMIHAEALNGFVAPGFTSFPTAIGLAASWDLDAVQEMADLIRRQMRSVGVLQALSPVLDIARDARWGRIHETYGEDVYLTSAMGVAFTRGLQGDDLSAGVLATAKHFLGYSMTEAGQNMAATHFGSRELYDVYATPFEAAIQLAGLGSVMNSYSEIDGVPVGSNRAILTDLLRGRMGFTGSVVSDYSTVEWLHTRQFVAESNAEAGVLAIEAGLDVELPIVMGYGEQLEECVRTGRLDESVLDIAVRRVLVDKFTVGLFDHPYVPEDPIVIGATATQGDELSQRLAEESITLLKNTGILPLVTKTKIAVIGPNAESALANFAAYTYPAHIDMMKGLATGQSRMAGVESMMDFPPDVAEEFAKEMAKLALVDTEAVARHAYGALSLADAIREAAPDGEVTSVTGVGIHPDDPQDISAAVAAAESADVVILAIGGRAGWFGTRITEGEGTDLASIELPSQQLEMVKAVAATGTPLIGVMYQGRPYALTAIDDLLDGLLVAYYPGPRGARAVASTLFGNLNPSGKLPYTLPRATGQIPIYYSQKRGSGYRRGAGDMFRGYIDLQHTPLYPFGHGLSYTAFEYGELQLSALDVPADGGIITATVEIRNTGDRDGSEVVQVYISDTATGVTRPAIALAGFARVQLPAGRRATVSIAIQMSQLGYSGIDGQFILEPGPITVSVGGSSDARHHEATFNVTGQTVVLEGTRSYLSNTSVSQADLLQG